MAEAALRRAAEKGTAEDVQRTWYKYGEKSVPEEVLLAACLRGSEAIAAACCGCGARFGLPSPGAARSAYVASRFEAKLVPGFYRYRGDDMPSACLDRDHIASVLRILHDSGSDLSEVRYYADLFGDEALSDTLGQLGVEVSDWRRRIISQAVPSGALQNAEHAYMEDVLLALDDGTAAAAVRLLARETSRGQIALRASAFEAAMDRETGAPLFSEARFPAALACTNLLTVFSAEVIAAAIIEAGKPEALAALLEFVRSDRQKDAVARAVREAGTDAHAGAVVLQHMGPRKSASSEALSFEDDPLSEEALAQLWSYEAASSTGLCITGYHGQPTHVIIPPRIGTKPVEFVEGSLFSRCKTDLRSVQFPGTLRNIPAHILDGAVNLEEITIADGVPVIGDGAFLDCGKAAVVLPDSVVSIGAGAFEGCASIQLTALPRQLRKLGKSAFENCTALDVPLGGTQLHTVAERAFAGTGITKAEIPGDMGRIEREAFAGCLELRAARVSPGTAVEQRAFYGCTSLETLDISPERTSLGAQAFASAGLRSVTLPDGLLEIGRGCFAGCQSLTCARLPRTMGVIPQHMFCGCSSLTCLQLPEGLQTIESAAFAKCVSLRSLELPPALREIGHGAFSECTSLERMDIPRGAEIDEEAFSGCAALALVRLPADLTHIPPECFADCLSLQEIEIPGTVTLIGAYAFEGSGLRTVTLPQEVRAIGDGAFSGCAELEDVVIEGRPRLGSHVFSCCPALHVRSG